MSAAVFVGHDWAEDHHDIHIEDRDGMRLHVCRLDAGLDGVRRLHAMLAEFTNDPSEVLIASETDRGLFITAMVSAGYRVIALNPMSTARYRECHSTSGAKSDRGDAQTLAAIARLDGHNHRLLEPDSALADAIKHTARAHQNLIWTRQRQLNQLRSVLREFFPAALTTFPELAHSDCLATLAIAPTPGEASRLSSARIAAALRRGGRRRGADAKASKIRAALRAEALRAPEQLETAMAPTSRRSSLSPPSSLAKSSDSRPNSLLCSTNTPKQRPSGRYPVSAPSSVHAFSENSATLQTDSPTPEAARTMPGRHQSPKPPDAATFSPRRRIDSAFDPKKCRPGRQALCSDASPSTSRGARSDIESTPFAGKEAARQSSR